MTNMYDKLRTAQVIPVIALDNADDAVPLADALAAGGIEVVEITLRTEAALAAAKQVIVNRPDIIVGIGTVITTEQIDQCVDIGADFIVTPGTSLRLAEKLASINVPAIPGISTAGEAVSLLEYGFDFQKFFPAEANGGVPSLKALAGPLPQIRFMPTGGISKDMARTYLDLPNVVAVGGSWVADKTSIATRDWAQITRNAKIATSL